MVAGSTAAILETTAGCVLWAAVGDHITSAKTAVQCALVDIRPTVTHYPLSRF